MRNQACLLFTNDVTVIMIYMDVFREDAHPHCLGGAGFGRYTVSSNIFFRSSCGECISCSCFLLHQCWAAHFNEQTRASRATE